MHKENQRMIARSFALAAMVCCACGTAKVASTVWEERGNHIGEPARVPGIVAYGDTVIDYRRSGKAALLVELREPVVIGVAEKPETWGYFQFPEIFRSTDGKFIFARWSMNADAISSYGKQGHAYAVSHDGGRTWSKPDNQPRSGQGFLLDNGDRIEIHTPAALKVEDVTLPDSIGFSMVTPTSKSAGYYYYRMKDLPEALQGVYLKRLRKGESEWKVEHARLDDPQGVRYSRAGLLPVVWWGDLQTAADGSVVAGIYPMHLQDASGKVNASGISFYQSTDAGHSWQLRSRIPYTYDPKVDPKGDERLVFGFTEPAFEVLNNGTFITVLRTNGPMYISRSRDDGKSWTSPEPFTQWGVLPKLLELENGVTVLASGRPGVQLRFSSDGAGETWTDAFEMMPFEGQTGYVSCGYTGLLATGPDRFLLIYSDFKYLNGQKEERKAIKVREVVVRNRSQAAR